MLTTKASCEFSSEKLLKNFPDSNKVPYFSAYKVKIKNGLVIAFLNGRINLTGFKTCGEAECALNFFAEKLDFNVNECNLLIQNITGSAKLPFEIDFNRVCKHPRSLYEPEIFPAVYFEDVKETIMFYHTGKFVLTRFKSEESIRIAHERFVSEMEGYKISNQVKDSII